MKAEEIIQLKAFARQDGAFLSLLWIVSFAFVVYTPTLPFGNLFAFITPFFVGWRLCKFRNYALDGVISYGRGLTYSVYTFVYASLLFAIVQYLYFMFLDGGRFMSMINDVVQAMTPMYIANGMSQENIDTSISFLASLTPIKWAFVFMVQDFIVGFVLSLLIAAVCMKHRSAAAGKD